jgi:hypothetical protein
MIVTRGYREGFWKRLGSTFDSLGRVWCMTAPRGIHKLMGEGRARSWWYRECHRKGV